ncbi:MAG TPA: hypothetical protein VJZ27_18230 [Aggregatilineales bacterium]|nr:hypothetical protein [Aggregatilineales bacterium]
MIVEILVSARIQGDLEYMPRLFTAIRELKMTLPYKALLIDTGQSASADSPICVMTENRAPYIVMDAMGYHFAFDDSMTLDNRERVQAGVQLRLIDSRETAIVMLGRYQLHVECDPTKTDQPRIENNKLILPLPEKYTILHLTLAVDTMQIMQTSTTMVSEDPLPDSTIAGTVEFVIGEARYYQRKRG